MRKNWIVFGLVLLLCGCTQEIKESDRNIITGPTAVSSTIDSLDATRVIESTTSSVSVGEIIEEMEKESVPIDLEHFGSDAFCNFILKNLDVDKDGVMSWEECRNITKLDLGLENTDTVQAPFDGTVRGFQYFPNLKELRACSAYKIEIMNHPALEQFITVECLLDEVRIENCPKLTTINCYGTFGKSKFYVQNCENLLWFETVEGYNETLTFVNTPNVVVVPSSVGELDMEAENFLGNSDTFPLDSLLRQKPVVNDGGKLEYRIDNTYIVWTGVKEGFISLSKEVPLQFITEKDIDCFTYEVFEGNEPVYDDAGKRRYYICITSKGSEHEKESLPIYLSEAPSIENLYVRVNQVEELTVGRYSPNNGIVFGTKMSFSLFYHNGEYEIEVGTIGAKRQRWTIDADGTARQMDE